MQPHHHPPYAALKQCLEDWKAASHLQLVSEPPSRNFHLIAHNTLIPELTKLASILKEAGFDCDIIYGEEDDPTVGIHVEALHVVLCLSPAANPTCIRAMAGRNSHPSDAVEWVIPMHLIAKGGLERELQAALTRLLKRPHTRPQSLFTREL